MATIQERKKRAQEALRKYKSASGEDAYACATDAITDILLLVAQTEDEGTQILQSAETEFRSLLEDETFAGEG